MRLLWAPFGWTLRVFAWVLCLPLGAYLSWRKGRNRRHRQTLEALREGGAGGGRTRAGAGPASA